MEFIEIADDDVRRLWPLHAAYKREIGEDAPPDGAMESLAAAVRAGGIRFFGCEDGGRLIGCCSVAPVYSTFNYATGGAFEDFYILPEARHTGVARKLVRFAVERSGVSSLTVGCAECDLEMYRALGFRVQLGRLLAYAF